MSKDWSQLSFKYTKTNTVLTCLYKDGKWGPIESQNADTYNLTVFSPSLHYGMSCFEGLKAFRGVDNKVRIFRVDENAKRMKSSAGFLGIPYPDEELFTKMCKQAVAENMEFLPPYELRAALYIRPILVTTIPSINLVPQNDGILFMVITLPVGSYGGKVLQPINSVIARDYDRAAPNGSGCYKVGGNYACAMFAGGKAERMGYKDVLYLNPGELKYIDEYSSANFFGIKDNTYITPLSKTILPSITNKSLEQVAVDLGMKVERRPIPVEELSTFEEVGQVGTAVVITPVHTIDDKPALESDVVTKSYKYDYSATNGCGPLSKRLYDTLTGIQYGEVEDKHGWITFVE